MGIKNTKTYKRGFKDGWEQCQREAARVAKVLPIPYPSYVMGKCMVGDLIAKAIAAMK